MSADLSPGRHPSAVPPEWARNNGASAASLSLALKDVPMYIYEA